MKSTDSVYALTGIKNYFLLPSRFDRMDINFKHHFSMIIDYFHMFLVRKTKVDRSSLPCIQKQDVIQLITTHN